MLQSLSGVMLLASVAKHTPDLTYQTLPLDPQQSSLAGKRPALLMPLHVTTESCGAMGKSLADFWTLALRKVVNVRSSFLLNFL